MKKKIYFIAFLFIVATLIYSCSKDEHRLVSNPEEQSIAVRNGKQGYIEHSSEEIAYINSIQIKVNALNHFDLGVDFENTVGSPDWNLAIIPQKNLGNYKSVIVPFIKANEINAFYYVFDGTELTYNFVDRSLISPPYFTYVGPVNHIYEQLFAFYDHVLSDTPFDDGNGYDDGTFDDAEFGGCFITTTAEVPCSCVGHTLSEECTCSNSPNGVNAYLEYTSTPVECPDVGGGGGGVTPGGTGPGFGSGSNGGNNNNNNNSADVVAALMYMYSVCPIISQQACGHLEFIILNASNSDYCLNIAMQVANLLENPTPANISAANCFIMNTSVQTYPSAPNSCSNPFSSAPLSDFAEMYNEMNTSLINWTMGYPGMDNIPCDLTVAGYSSDEKNQILQAFKDYLGHPPAVGLGDIPAPNTKLEKVNELNAILSNTYYPELIDLISNILEWNSFDNLPEISNFLKVYTSPIDQNVKNMLALAANVSDKSFLNEILALLEEDNDSEAILATSMTFVTFNSSSIYGPYDQAYYIIINPYTEANIIDPTLIVIWGNYFSANCAVLKQENPDWSDAKIYWYASKEMIHLALDLAGLVPVFGEVFDLTNGVIYTIEGDGVNATLSYASSIPVIGWFPAGAKFGKKIVTLANGTKTTLKWVVRANNVIDFGKRGQLRKVLGIEDAAKHAHHIAPWIHKGHEIIQAAAKSKLALHMNEALNGLAVASWRNQPNHNLYNERFLARLDALKAEFPNIDNDQAFTKVTELLNEVRALIISNPNSHLNDIIF